MIEHNGKNKGFVAVRQNRYITETGYYGEIILWRDASGCNYH